MKGHWKEDIKINFAIRLLAQQAPSIDKMWKTFN